MKEQKNCAACFFFFFFLEGDEAAKLTSKVDAAIFIVFYLTCIYQNYFFLNMKCNLLNLSVLEKMLSMRSQ